MNYQIKYDYAVAMQMPSLSNIDPTSVNKSLKQILPEFRKLLFKYKMNKVYGLCLLHKHFNISNEELYVRSLKGQRLYLKSLCTSELSKYDLVPYTLKFSNEDIYVVEYIIKSNNVNYADFESKNELEFIKSVSKLIRENNSEHCFGLQLLTKVHEKLPEIGYAFIEATDPKTERCEITEMMDISKNKPGDIVITNWSYAPYSSYRRLITMGCEFYPGGCYTGDKHTTVPDQHIKY